VQEAVQSITALYILVSLPVQLLPVVLMLLLQQQQEA
jgi:hypothetical protein